MIDIIIMNAGMSRRLQDAFPDTPKAIIESENGSTILDYQLRMIEGVLDYVDRVFIVIGYKHNLFEQYLYSRKSNPRMKIHLVLNNKYSTTDNSYSAFLALNAASLKNPVIILDGDVIFKTCLLKELIDIPLENCLVGIEKTDCTSEDAKILTQNGYALGVGKQVISSILYCSMIKLSKEFLSDFYRELESVAWWKTWYSEPLTQLLQKNPQSTGVLISKDGYLMEADTPEEMAIALAYISHSNM